MDIQRIRAEVSRPQRSLRLLKRTRLATAGSM